MTEEDGGHWIGHGVSGKPDSALSQFEVPTSLQRQRREM
jgi:hypothetical protein